MLDVLNEIANCIEAIRFFVREDEELWQMYQDSIAKYSKGIKHIINNEMEEGEKRADLLKYMLCKIREYREGIKYEKILDSSDCFSFFIDIKAFFTYVYVESEDICNEIAFEMERVYD
ncbi:MAG: hypothetical protein ACOYJD_03470 [Christensenellales bacterium]|jgi:hypothetical protein